MLTLLLGLGSLTASLAPTQAARVAERLRPRRARSPLGRARPAAVGARALGRTSFAWWRSFGELLFPLHDRLERLALFAQLLVGQAHCRVICLWSAFLSQWKSLRRSGDGNGLTLMELELPTRPASDVQLVKDVVRCTRSRRECLEGTRQR